MGKHGKTGRHRWIISEWLDDVDGAEFWLTVLAVAGWWLLLVVLLWGA